MRKGHSWVPYIVDSDTLLLQTSLMYGGGEMVREKQRAKETPGLPLELVYQADCGDKVLTSLMPTCYTGSVFCSLSSI